MIDWTFSTLWNLDLFQIMEDSLHSGTFSHKLACQTSLLYGPLLPHRIASSLRDTAEWTEIPDHLQTQIAGVCHLSCFLHQSCYRMAYPQDYHQKRIFLETFLSLHLATERQARYYDETGIHGRLLAHKQYHL
jgi:hypothetical protein